MPEGIHRTGPAEILPGGETLTVDGSTVADPETGQPVPAAVLRLPAWRTKELAAALDLWNQLQTLVLTAGAHLPSEAALASRLSAAGETLDH
jgi:hypothetical protein